MRRAASHCRSNGMLQTWGREQRGGVRPGLSWRSPNIGGWGGREDWGTQVPGKVVGCKGGSNVGSRFPDTSAPWHMVRSMAVHFI